MAFDANKLREIIDQRDAERATQQTAQTVPEESGSTWVEDRKAELHTEMEDSETEETYTFDPEESRENFNAIGTLVTNTARDISEAATDYAMAEYRGEEPDGMRVLLSPAKETAREFIAAYAPDNESRFQGMAQGLRRSGANLEYFMTPEEKTAMARRISQKFPQIPESALAGDTEAMQNALGAYDYASKLEAVGGDVNKVYEKYPVLKELADKGDTRGVTLALHDMKRVDEETEIIQAFKNGWRHGEANYEYGILKHKEAYEGLTDDEQYDLEKLEKTLKETEQYVPSFWVDSLVSMAAGGAESLPEMLYSYGKSRAYAIAGAAVGAALGGAPTGGFGLPAGALAGWTWGGRAGLTYEMFRPMMGRKFAEYQAMTDEHGAPLMTRSQARELATIETVPEALIEMGGFEFLGFGRNLAGKGFAKKAFQTIISDGKAAITAKTAGKFLAEVGKEMSVGTLRETASEAGEEFLQAYPSDLMDAYIEQGRNVGSSDLGVPNTDSSFAREQISKNMDFSLSRFMGTLGEADWGDITKKAVAQGMEAVPGALFLGGVSSVGGVPMGGIRYGLESRAWRRQWGGMAKEERTTAAGTVMLEQLQATVQDSKLKDTAPDVQREIMREELKETPWQMAYVDVETALKNENGLADVREAGKAAGLTDEEIKQAVEEKGTIAVPLECYAQSAASPELLDSVSFSPEAEPLAKIRENAKAAQEAYTKRMTAETKKQIELVEAMTKELFPEKREQDAAMMAIIQNPENPAQGWRELHEQATAALDEILAPALSALERGMGQGVDEIRETNEYGEAKGDIVGRVSNNEEWYREFYKEHKRRPNKEELREMARKMMTGEADAPKVQGWTATDKETAALMENEKGRLAAAEEEIALLESVKERMQELNGAEMKLTEGMSPEAYKVYRTITTDLLKFGGKPGRAARVSALLWARHADVYAKRMRTKPGFENYTATDWLKDTIRGIVQGRAQGYNQANVDNGTILETLDQFAGENAETADKMKLAEAQRMEAEGKAPDEIYKATGWFKGLDGKWRFEIPDNLDRIDLSPLVSNNVYHTLGGIYDNPALYKAYPELGDMLVGKVDLPMSTRAQLTNENGEIVIQLNANAMGDANIKNALVHEIQHWIQFKERFAIGGNAGTVREQLFNQWMINEKGDPTNRSLAEAYNSDEADNSLYWRLGGEQEARKAADRANGHTRYARTGKRLVNAEFAFQKLRESLPEAERAQVEEYLAARDEARKASREEARHEGMEDEEQYTQARKAAWDKESDLEAALPENVLEALQEISNAEWSLSFGKEALEELPKPHESDALIVFGGEEMPYSENWDERLAGNRAAKEKWNNTSKVPVNHPVRAMRDALDEKTRQMWDESGLEPEEWAEAYDAMQEAMESVGDKIESAKTHEELDEIRDSLKPVLLRQFEANKAKTKEGKLKAATDLRCAREAFENDERIREARNRIDETVEESYKRARSFREGKSLKLGLLDGGSAGISGTDYAVNGFLFRPANGKNASNDYYLNALKNFTPTQQDTAQAQSRSEHQGGFSDARILDTLNQAVAQGNLGRTVSYSDGTRLVELFESADESTFLHESGHIFLMDLERLAAMGDEESKADLALVEEWAAFRDGDEKKYRGTPWAQEFAERARHIREAEKNGAAKMPDGTTKTMDQLLREWKQERFARAFEIYLYEGKAPSKGLRNVFRKFCEFLEQVYTVLVSDGARASAQVEAVMGRLMATDEEIEAMEEDERYQDFMKAGGEKLLYEDAEETFSRWHEEAKEEARDKLRKIVMRSMTGKMARRRKEILRDARIKKETELSNQPVYLARQAAKETGIKDAWQAYFPNKEAWEKADKTAPTMEEALDAYMRKYEADLDTKEVQEVLKEETIEKAMSSTRSHEKLLRMEQRAFARKAALADRLSGKPRRRMEDVERWIEEMPDALDRDDMGTWHKAVTSLKLSNRWTKEELDAIDMLSVSASKEAAQQNFEALRKIIKERKVGLADLREANRGRVEALRKQAKETIRKQTLAQATQVATHRKAEKEAAKEAGKLAKQEKWAEAAAAKERELLAAFMATEAEKVRNRRDAILKHIRAQLAAKTKLPKDERYWHQHLAYLLRIADTDAAKPDGLKSLAEIAKALGDGLDVATDEDGRSDLLGLMEKLADENTRQDGYHGMKLEELEDAADVLTVLYTTGRDKFNLKLTKGKTIGEAVKEILEDKTAYNGAKVRQSTVTGNPNRGGVFWSETLSRIPGAGDALAKVAQRYGLSLTKPEELINLLGEKAHKYIYDTYDRAAEQEAAMTADFVGKMEAILAKRYTPQEMREWQARKYDWRGQGVSKENILAMALNLGNEINMDRLVAGLQTNEAEITQFIADRMTEKDWLFCQDVWDLLHEYWPETVRVEMELNGTRLVPQTARAFNVKTKDKNGNETEVKLRGGYYPIKYDPELSDKARETAENAEAKASMSGATVLGIGRGFTKDRAAKGAVKERPLLLSLSVIPEHVGEAVHNITTRIAARDVYRILNHADMKAYVNATLGMDAYNVLTTWATDVWKIKPEEGNGAAKVVNSLLRPIRQNAGIAIMGYRMWPTVENATNIFPMMDALGAAETLSAIKDYYGNKAEFDEMIAKSMFMRERTERMDRDMKGQRGMFEKKNAVSEWLVKHAYDPITFTDLLTSKPLWARAYKNAFPKMLEAVRQENEENAKTFAERRAEYDKINATILDMRKRRQEMEAELRRRARREAPQAETAYTRMSRTTLQDEIHILDGEIEDKGKALFVAGEKMERASSLVIRTERETLDEATQRAVLAADKAVRDVIGSGDVKDLSEVQRSRNEAVKALTMFYSYFNTQANAIISAHWKGKWQGGAKYDFTPIAKAIAYRFLLTSLLSTVMRWAFFGEGDDDKDKYKKDKEGHKIEVPALQRFLAQYAKNALSTTIGGAYGLREVGNQLINRLIEGRSYGARFDGMYGSLYDQTAKAAELIWMKRERDEKAREEEEKRQERYKNATPTQRKRMRQEERYRKPPNTISYADILRSVGDVGASLTAGYTGATAPLVGTVLGTMQYLFDSDGRYDATLGNMMWSAFWTKKPVKKKPPEKPEKPKKEQKGR